MKKLSGMRVAMLVTDGFEQVELTGPRRALEDEGAVAEIVSPAHGFVRGWKYQDWGRRFRVDVTLDQADPSRYDALVLPGGVINPDTLRLNPKAIAFIKAFGDAGKPIAAICHGPWTLIDAGVARGKTLTSWASLATDLRNAGAHWVDREMVRDGQLVTSRKPTDLAAFDEGMIQLFAERVGGRAAAGVAETVPPV